MINQRPSGWILRTSAIGLVSLGGQMSAALYNAYLPIFYGAFIASNTLIGLVMIIDNIASLGCGIRKLRAISILRACKAKGR